VEGVKQVKPAQKFMLKSVVKYLVKIWLNPGKNLLKT
jgi:hypothetical protein